MKKAIIIILTVVFLLPLFADDYTTLGTSQQTVSAYKLLTTDGVPDAELQLRLIDTENNNDVADDSHIDIPIHARSVDYEAFSWVVSGNIYNNVTVKFTFSPMYWEANSSSTSIIPYTVTLEHIQSRIGNTPIPYNATSNATSKIDNTFTEYSYKYSDGVTGMSTVSVSNAAQTVTVNYNMSSYTKIWDAYNNQVSTYGLDVCNYWNRYGSATVNLGITAEGYKQGTTTKFSDGVYYASVIVEIVNP